MQICRTLPYRLRLVNAAALDVTDAVSSDATRERDTGRIVATVRVYGNDSRVGFDISELDGEHALVRITMLSAPPELSREGRERTLTHLADSMEQLLESSLRASV